MAAPKALNVTSAANNAVISSCGVIPRLWSGPRGEAWNLDLNAEHAQQLRDALAAYVRAARRVSGGSRRPARGGRRGSASTLNTTEVREWAKAQGIEVKDRGRVPAELVVKFKAATSQ